MNMFFSSKITMTLYLNQKRFDKLIERNFYFDEILERDESFCFEDPYIKIVSGNLKKEVKKDVKIVTDVVDTENFISTNYLYISPINIKEIHFQHYVPLSMKIKYISCCPYVLFTKDELIDTKTIMCDIQKKCKWYRKFLMVIFVVNFVSMGLLWKVVHDIFTSEQNIFYMCILVFNLFMAVFNLWYGI